MTFDEPTNWGPPSLEHDPFTTVYRGSSDRRKGRGNAVYHLDPSCPLIGDRILRSRLGSLHAHGWILCQREANPFAWNLPASQAELREQGRRRAMERLGVPS